MPETLQNKLILSIVYIYIAVDLCQLHHVIPGMKYLKLGILTQALLLLINLLHFSQYRGDKKILILRFLFILVIVYGLFWGMDPGRTFMIAKSDIPRYFSGFLGICLFINKIENFKVIMKILGVSGVLISIYVILNNGHGPGGMLIDENDVGAFLVMLLPVPYFLLITKKRSWQKILNILSLIIILIGIIVTTSRGTMVGTIPIIFLIWFRAKKKLLSTALVLILLFNIIIFAPKEFINEFKSISDLTENTAASRIYFWKLSWLMFLEKPLLGVGALGWAHAIWGGLVPYDMSVRNVTPHSMYFQLISEVGIIGTMIYCLIIYITIKNLFSLSHGRLFRQIKNLGYNLEKASCTDFKKTVLLYSTYSSAFLFSFCGFSICSIFISTLFYPPIHFLIFLSVALKNSWEVYYKNLKIDSEKLSPDKNRDI